MDYLVDTFANRLSYALKLRSMKPIELSEITHIDKSKISSYMSGRYKAKTDGLKIIADALDVSPVWLMGYDVPMNSFHDNNKDNSISSIPLLSNYSKSLDFSIENFFIKNININDNTNKETFALKTNNEAMSPALGLGDIAIVEKTDTFKDEQVCLISLDDNIMIRIIKDYKSYIELQALNYHFEAIKLTKEDMEKRKFKVIGKVIRAENESFFK